MIFLFISSLCYDLLDFIDAIHLLTFHSVISSYEVVFALFITFHGNCLFMRKNLRSCQVGLDLKARVDHFSASLRIIAINDEAKFHHADMTIRSAIIAMNVTKAKNVTHAKMVNS